MSAAAGTTRSRGDRGATLWLVTMALDSNAALPVIGARRSLQLHVAPFVPLGRPQCADFASQAFTPGYAPTAR
jgi:hypothetical protein